LRNPAKAHDLGVQDARAMSLALSARKGAPFMQDFISTRVKDIPPSAIRDFFDILATMDDVISLGIGEPDFPGRKT
jgi:hypothetical protein